jgi:hypothetical protein
MARRGRSSEVERQLPKLNVVGSIPIARSTQEAEMSGFLLFRIAPNKCRTKHKPAGKSSKLRSKVAIDLAIPRRGVAETRVV